MNANKLTVAASALAVVAIAGCATKSADVAPTYTSTNTYAGLSCRQITAERDAIASEVSRVSVAQDKQRKKDQIATGVGAVVFWPALLYNVAVKDDADQLGRLKGQYDALGRMAGEKGCSA